MDNNNKKTLIMVCPYFPPAGGGLERYAFEIAKRLVDNFGWKITVITSGEFRGADVKEDYQGLTVYRLSYDLKISNTPLALGWRKKIKKILKDEQPSLINIHMPVAGIGDVTGLVAGKIPVVITYHAGTMVKNKILPDILIRIYENLFLPFLLRKAKAIVCSSGYVSNVFLRNYRYKSIIITPGVDTQLFRPHGVVPAAVPTVLFVAGLNRSQQHKGLRVLIQAMGILTAKVPSAKLLIVGDGDMKDDYKRQIAKLKIHDSVIFAGQLSGEPLVNAYEQSSLVVLPSLEPAESFGMVLIEAMAVGRPVIGSDIGGIPTVIDHGKDGLLVQPNSPVKLAKAMELILTDHALAHRLSESGLVKAMNFSWADRAKAYDELFDSVLNKKNDNSIAQVTAYYPPHLGGMETVAKNVSEGLAKNGWEVESFFSSIGIKRKLLEPRRNLKLHAMSSFEFAHIPFAPAFPFYLLSLPKKSLIHLHLSQAYYPELVLLFSKLRDIPYVVHFHLDVGPSGFFGPLFLVYKKIVWGPVLRNAKKVIALSNDQARLVNSKFGVLENNITVVPNAVGSQFYTNKKYSMPDTTFKLLYIGRLTVQKRVDRLLEVMSKLKIPASLTIVGDGEDRQKLQKMAEALGLKNVSFVGAKPADEIPLYHSSHHALVMSSQQEAGPLVLLEAMAAGLPIIGTEVAGIKEALVGVGVIVPQPYVENFVTELENLWKNPKELIRLSNQSRKTAEKFTLSHCVALIEQIYLEVLK